MRKDFFEEHFFIRLAGSEHNKVAGADGSSMVAFGSAILYLCVSGLPALAPIQARITLCDNMDPNFLLSLLSY